MIRPHSRPSQLCLLAHKPIVLPALGRFALDVQNALISTFQFDCLPPHLVRAPLLPPNHLMMAETLPNDEVEFDEPEPDEDAHWLSQDIMRLVASHVDTLG